MKAVQLQQHATTFSSRNRCLCPNLPPCLGAFCRDSGLPAAVGLDSCSGTSLSNQNAQKALELKRSASPLPDPSTSLFSPTPTYRLLYITELQCNNGLGRQRSHDTRRGLQSLGQGLACVGLQSQDFCDRVVVFRSATTTTPTTTTSIQLEHDEQPPTLHRKRIDSMYECKPICMYLCLF